jgi:hypothetical protein
VLRQRRDQRGLVDQRAAAGVDDDGIRLHPAEILGTDDAAGLRRQDDVQGDHVGTLEQRRLLHALDADGGGGLGGQVAAPGDGGHAEGLADLGDAAAELAEAQHAERQPVQRTADAVGRAAGLPGAGTQAGGLRRQVAQQGDDEAPGDVDGGRPGARRAADGDALRIRGGDVEGAVALAGRDQELQVGQPPEQACSEGRAFADAEDGVEGAAGRSASASSSVKASRKASTCMPARRDQGPIPRATPW